MANVSNWKNFEREIAAALGGKRRLRTMESYGKEATDVYFPKKVRRMYHCLRTVAVECKKRKTLNVHQFFVEAKLKYGKGGKRIILASRRPATKSGLRSFKRMKTKLRKRYGKEIEKLKLSLFIVPLVTVELDFFRELFEAWKENSIGKPS